MKDTRIIFMGTPDFAANVLTGLIKEGYNIIGVVTQMDKKVGRRQTLTPSAVKRVALDHHVPVFTPKRIRKEYDDILALDPELIITCAYGQIIPKAILDYPRCGCINTHGSLLPLYRGGAPIQHAIINGEKETGITLMYMDEKMDEGDILFSARLPIAFDDTNETLFAKLSDLALKMLLEHLDAIIDGKVKPIKQDQTKATYAYNLTKEDEYINFNEPYLNVYNHIRGLLKNPGAYAMLEGKKYKFHKVRPLDEKLCPPATVYGLYDGGFLIGAQGGSIIVDEIQPEGKSVMKAKDFFNGQGRGLVGKEFDEKYES